MQVVAKNDKKFKSILKEQLNLLHAGTTTGTCIEGSKFPYLLDPRMHEALALQQSRGTRTTSSPKLG